MLAIQQAMFISNTFYDRERARYVCSDRRERSEVAGIRKAVHDFSSHTKNLQLKKFISKNGTESYV